MGGWRLSLVAEDLSIISAPYSWSAMFFNAIDSNYNQNHLHTLL